MKTALIVAMLLIVAAISAGCTSSPPVQPVTTTPATPPATSVSTVQTRVQLDTSMGNITIALYGDMPVTAGNFETLVRQGFYDNTTFHRVMFGFMIQGGDPTGTGYGGPGYTIPDEFAGSHRNVRGTVAMANTGMPDSGGSQFFINTVDNPHLNGKHPVFGEVVSGMDIVDEISKVQTDMDDRPVQNVTIRKATIL